MPKIKLLFQKFINSIRIPPLLSFFILKNGKINPTKKEIFNDAPPAKENWMRMGLEKYWLFFAIGLLAIMAKLFH